MKNGILLAGGLGTRLQPFTSYVSKHLINVGDKPIIDYPINTLKKMGVENLTIIVGSSFSGRILDYVQEGSRYGLNIHYRYQLSANGIAGAVNLCQRNVDDEDEFVVCLGDNLFEKEVVWNNSCNDKSKAQILVKQVPDPHRFGVISCDVSGKIEKIEEKPKVLDPQYSHYAITGCYLFTQRFFEYFKDLVPSSRGEFEVTNIIEAYHRDNLLTYSLYDAFWSDMGTHESIGYVNNYFYQKKNTTT